MANIVVLGPGALGLIFAARLDAAGHDVTLGVRNKERAKNFSQPVRITGLGPMEAQLDASDKPLACDLLIVATKRHDIKKIASPWAALATRIVVIQNGLPQPEIEEFNPIHASVWFPASVRGPTESEQTGSGGIHIAGGDDVQEVATILAAVAPTSKHDDALPMKWSKLLVNSCITGLGAVAGCGLGQLLPHKHVRTMFLDIVAEGHAVARAQGIVLPTIEGFSPAFFAATNPLLRPFQHVALRILGRRARGHESSSLQSLRKQELTEVSDLNGEIARQALEHGLLAPTNTWVWERSLEIEQGHVEPDFALLGTFTRPDREL